LAVSKEKQACKASYPSLKTARKKRQHNLYGFERDIEHTNLVLVPVIVGYEERHSTYPYYPTGDRSNEFFVNYRVHYFVVIETEEYLKATENKY